MMALFCAVVGVLLALSYVGFYLMFERVVEGQFDRELQQTAGPIIADMIRDRDDERDIDRLDIPGQYFEVISVSGHVLERSKNLKSPLQLTLGKTLQNVESAEAGTLRAGLFPYTYGKESLFLVVAAPTHDVDSALTTMRRSALVVFPIALLLTALISRLFVARSLKPVADVTQQASAMIRELSPSPDAKLETLLSHSANPDELHRLSVTFNALFDRLNAVLAQLRQFVSDAAHEIRTPLSILRGETELLLAKPRTTEEYEQAVRIMDSELKKLSRMVDGLFTLSMADAGQLRLATEPLYLEEILEDACALAAPLAKNKQIRIEKHLQRDILIPGDPAFLRQLFLIFIDNAVKYSSPGTQLDICLESGKDVQVRFKDQGIGIRREHQTRIFERFFRVAQNGSQDSQSGGLGLSIAQAIVQAHHGAIECASEPGIGTTFTIRFPLSK
jgi:heavy metal sensor kinase